LQFYPLALSQAVAYIKNQQRISLQGYSYSVRKYLAEYDSGYFLKTVINDKSTEAENSKDEMASAVQLLVIYSLIVFKIVLLQFIELFRK